jgi:hypothetical protein
MPRLTLGPETRRHTQPGYFLSRHSQVDPGLVLTVTEEDYYPEEDQMHLKGLPFIDAVK